MIEPWRQAAAVAAGGLLVIAAPAEARWTRGYVDALPDGAFAAVEVQPDGARVRRLPHHDADGRVDLPHLRSALGRLGQVKWADPAEAERARRHLLEHLEEVRPERGRPAGGSRGGVPQSPAGRSTATDSTTTAVP